jgi:energy-coupling factor transporter ATP-binding protein EcfA2
MTTLIANYEAEQKAFHSLLDPGCEDRILLFHGSSGSGKTTLLTCCRESVPKQVVSIPIQLRGSAVSVAEIFYRAGRNLSWEKLENFTDEIARLEGTPSAQVDKNWLAGINNRISIVMQVQDSGDREHRRVALTEAWFNDVAEFDHPVVMILDTYEQATTEVQEWLSGPFLSRVVQVEPVRVVVAGQSVPEKNNIEWGHCCVEHDLYGVKEAKHWLPIVKAMKRKLDVKEPLDWLGGMCVALKGNPAEIIKVIEALPVE